MVYDALIIVSSNDRPPKNVIVSSWLEYQVLLAHYQLMISRENLTKYWPPISIHDSDAASLAVTGLLGFNETDGQLMHRKDPKDDSFRHTQCTLDST